MMPSKDDEHFREDELVIAASAPNEIEAQLWKGILEDAGIESMVKVSESANLYVSPMMLKHEIWVLSGDLERARAVLGEIQDAPNQDLMDDQES